MSQVVGYAPGIFDLFHVGHVNLLRRARLRCDVLIAGVVTDEVAEIVKGRPIVPEHERLEIVSAVEFVDQAVLEHSTDRMDIWRELGFHVIFKGADWRDSDKGRRLEAQFAPVGVRVEYFDYTPITSDTHLSEFMERPR